MTQANLQTFTFPITHQDVRDHQALAAMEAAKLIYTQDTFFISEDDTLGDLYIGCWILTRGSLVQSGQRIYISWWGQSNPKCYGLSKENYAMDESYLSITAPEESIIPLDALLAFTDVFRASIVEVQKKLIRAPQCIIDKLHQLILQQEGIVNHF